jgi:hypothetical protein
MMREGGHVARVRELGNSYRILSGKLLEIGNFRGLGRKIILKLNLDK